MAKTVVDEAIMASNAHASDIILVLPPFASPDRPSLGLHILQQIAQAKGYKTTVLYANLSFARLVGPHLYRHLCHTPTEDLIGERLFRLAWPSSADFGSGAIPERWSELAQSAPSFQSLQEQAVVWSEAMARGIAALDASVIGFSSTFEQTLSSLSIASRLKKHAPDKTTILGGANADDVMGEALADLAPEIDHVFQGEAESAFLAFLEARSSDEPIDRVLPGLVNERLEDIPAPDYSDFFLQWTALVDEATTPDGLRRSEIRLPYESSRGCWWGAKHHCTFCGLNANGMNHRTKSAEKVEREIMAMSLAYDVNRVLMVDNIMPHNYVSTLLPRLAAAEQKLDIFYEQKANLGRRRMSLLRDAGVTTIQPGIESLSTPLLKRMNKGTSLGVNLDCLRHARASGVSLAWNLLSDFPGDDQQNYEDMIRIIPLLHHLEPPSGLGGLSIDRFSPYHMTPEAYGISEVRPLPAYAEVFPNSTDHRLAYHFEGDYRSALRQSRDLKTRMEAVIEDWLGAWRDVPPILYIFDLEEDRHLLVDTRVSFSNEPKLMSTAEANLLLKGAASACETTSKMVEQGHLIEADGRLLPISCAALESPAWDYQTSQTQSVQTA